MKHLIALFTASIISPTFSEAAQLVHQYNAHGNAQLSQRAIVLGSRLNANNTLVVVESLIPKEQVGVINGLRVSKVDLNTKTTEVLFEQPPTINGRVNPENIVPGNTRFVDYISADGREVIFPVERFGTNEDFDAYRLTTPKSGSPFATRLSAHHTVSSDMGSTLAFTPYDSTVLTSKSGKMVVELAHSSFTGDISRDGSSALITRYDDENLNLLSNVYSVESGRLMGTVTGLDYNHLSTDGKALLQVSFGANVVSGQGAEPVRLYQLTGLIGDQLGQTQKIYFPIGQKIMSSDYNSATGALAMLIRNKKDGSFELKVTQNGKETFSDLIAGEGRINDLSDDVSFAGSCQLSIANYNLVRVYDLCESQ